MKADKLPQIIVKKDTKSTLSHIFFEYILNSTIHGLRYLFERNRHWCERYDKINI